MTNRKEQIALQIGQLLYKHRGDTDGNGLYESLGETFPDAVSKERSVFVQVTRDYLAHQNDVELRIGLSIISKFSLNELLPDLVDLRSRISKRGNFASKLGLLMEVDDLISGFTSTGAG